METIYWVLVHNGAKEEFVLEKDFSSFPLALNFYQLLTQCVNDSYRVQLNMELKNKTNNNIVFYDMLLCN